MFSRLLSTGVALTAILSAGPTISLAQDGGDIVVGHYASMTGAEATFGVSTDNAIKLAVEEFNAAGGLKGRKIKLITYDDQSKGSEVGTVVQRLINQDKVVALLGEVASSRSIAGGRIAQQAGVPMITPSSTNPQVTHIGNMISRVCFLDTFQGYVMAKFARDNIKAAKAAILYDQSQAYSKGLAEYFKKSFTELGGTIVSEQAFNGGDQDFGAQLTTIRGTNPDVVCIPGYYNDAGNIAIQARDKGIKVPLLGGDGWDSSKLAEIGKGDIEGCYYSNHYAPDQPTPEVENFVKKYKAKYGETPDGLAALGYDAANLLFDAMKRAASLKGQDLAKAINETKGFRGVTGTITIDKDRNAEKTAVVVQMKGGQPTYVATFEPKK